MSNEELSAKIDQLGNMVGTLSAKIDGVETSLAARIEALDAKVDGVEAKLTTRIDDVARDVKAVRVNVEHNRRTLQEHTQMLRQHGKGLDSHEQRMDRQERVLNALARHLLDPATCRAIGVEHDGSPVPASPKRAPVAEPAE